MFSILVTRVLLQLNLDLEAAPKPFCMHFFVASLVTPPEDIFVFSKRAAGRWDILASQRGDEEEKEEEGGDRKSVV